MGQFHCIVNIDKREFIHPCEFNDGQKLMEFGHSGAGTLFALSVLLSNSRHRGGGDLYSDDTEYYGRWAGDRIVIAGDYAEPPDNGEPEGENLYKKCDSGTYTDISSEIKAVIRATGEQIRGSA